MARLTTEERERRHKAAARAAIVGIVKAAEESGLPPWAIKHAMGEIGVRTANRPKYNREERRLIAEDSVGLGVHEAATKYGVSIVTIKSYRSEFKVGGARLRRRQILELAAELVRGNRTHPQLASKHGVAVSTIEAIAAECREVGLI